MNPLRNLIRSALPHTAWGLWIGVALSVPYALCAQPQVPATGQQERLLERARKLMAQEDYASATKIYEQILRDDSDSYEALNNLGVAETHLGRYPQAASAYERALRLQPKSFPLQLNLGLCYFKGGDFSNAAGALEKALSLQPDNFQARSLLAMAYYSKKDFIPASREFERLTALEPNNTTLQYLLAESYLWSGQNQALLDYFEKLQQRSTDSVTVHMLMGEANDGMGRTDNAIREFEAAAALAPHQPNLHFGLGYLFWEKHQYPEAAEQFKLEIQNGGSVAKSEAYLGDIALRNGQDEQAQRLLERCIREYPKSRIAHFDLGVLYARRKLYDGAVREFSKAIELDPTRVDSHYRLAGVLRAQGKVKESRAELQKVNQIHHETQETLLQEISGNAKDETQH